MNRGKDLKGLRFTKLVVIQKIGKDRHRNLLWECMCDCGNTCSVQRGSLLGGGTKSCGCLNIVPTRFTHKETFGGIKTKEYRSWGAMKARCTSKYQESHLSYKGIKVCDRWLHSFENFLEDMGRAPTTKHSIDRIDNDGNYAPANCRWATDIQQVRNRGVNKNNTSGTTGVQRTYKGLNKKQERLYQWLAKWHLPSGKIKVKAFSENKYGRELAQFLAEETRSFALKIMNFNGAGYRIND